MPCPSFNITIVQRSAGESAAAASAYQSGETLFCEYDQQVKDYGRKDRVVYKEIMLPPNAPSEYADRQKLWNAAESVERSWKSQLARRFKIALPRELSQEENRRLARQFCEEQFLSKGMIVDLAVHDKGDGNPHFHVLTTMRALDDQGRWLPKCHREDVLDENGERICLPSGRWKSRKVDTVDWNDKKYGEIWRHEWEVLQNQYLEKANQPERIDMRSYERQGVDRLPQVHLGAAASALERKGVQTELGDRNRQIVQQNNERNRLHELISNLKNWLAEIGKKIVTQEIIAAPKDHDLATILLAYMDLRKDERGDWSVYAKQKGGVNDLKKIAATKIYLDENKIYTVSQLAEVYGKEDRKIKSLKATLKKNNSRLRDISDVMKAAATIQKHQAVWKEYSAISWKGRKQKYYESHEAELEAYKKADRLLRKLKITLPLDEAALKSESTELSRKNEQLYSELKASETEMKQLRDIRYYVRKVMPDALPMVDAEGRVSSQADLEAGRNRNELRELTEDPPERPEQQKTKSDQEH